MMADDDLENLVTTVFEGIAVHVGQSTAGLGDRGIEVGKVQAIVVAMRSLAIANIEEVLRQD